VIDRIRGILIYVADGKALVDVGGITYGIFITRAVGDRLVAMGQLGKEITIHTMNYIEGNVASGNLIPRLVGFLNETDLEFFSLLTTVQGLGVKKVLRALTIPVKDMAKAIELNDIDTLTSLPEIGTKTAQKIIVELKGKVAKFALLREEDIPYREIVSEQVSEYQREAIAILIQLQYSEFDAKILVRKTIEAHPELTTAEGLIQEIFKRQVTTL
jgi:holliday junction DNA helicase RuvA